MPVGTLKYVIHSLDNYLLTGSPYEDIYQVAHQPDNVECFHLVSGPQNGLPEEL